MQEPGFDFTNLSIKTLNQYKSLIIHQVNLAIDNIVNINEKRTFANTCQPLINVNYLITPYKNSLDFAINFYPSKELREVAQEIEKEINKFLIETFLRKDLYYAFLDYENSTYQSEKSHLTNEENRYFEFELRDFKRKGLGLNDYDYNQVKTMLKELSELSTKFQNNLNEVTTSFRFTKEELNGVPSHWFSDDKIIDVDGINYYKVTLKYPDYFPIMEYAEDENVRKKLFVAYSSRCEVENTEIMKNAIELRFKIANKLGYKNHADYKTETKIIKTGQNALDFETNMNEKFTELYRNDMKMLLEFALIKSNNPIKKDKLDLWDFMYYMRELTEKECDINMEELRKYFPLETVKNGMFSIYQTILGLVFTEINTTNKWHEDAILYKVNDKISNELMGYFYLDLHPRDGKYGHAAAFEFVPSCDKTKINGGNERQHHIMAVACNFPKDGCISHDDVVTLFHEFGHVMHQICSKPQLQSFVGFAIERDFVETFSQVFEYWCYAPESLKLMSNGITDDVISKLKKTKHFLAGYTHKRQIVFGLADLKMHMLTDFNKPCDLQELWYSIENEVLEVDNCIKLYPFANFGHIMGGYSAGYYGYLLSLTYASHIFNKMIGDENVLNPEIGMNYRKILLEVGSSVDSIDQLTKYLGEVPSNDYFINESLNQ